VKVYKAMKIVWSQIREFRNC